MQQYMLEVRRKLVKLMREDPPFRLVPGGSDGPVLDRWMARRLSPEDLLLLQQLEKAYGETALAELFAEVLLESGVVRPFGVN